MATGPNAPCPCGSGRKYKHCCGRPGQHPGQHLGQHEERPELSVLHRTGRTDTRPSTAANAPEASAMPLGGTTLQIEVLALAGVSLPDDTARPMLLLGIVGRESAVMDVVERLPAATTGRAC